MQNGPFKIYPEKAGETTYKVTKRIAMLKINNIKENIQNYMFSATYWANCWSAGINPLMTGDNERSYILKQTCCFQLQVCLSKYDLLLPLRFKRVKGCFFEIFVLTEGKEVVCSVTTIHKNNSICFLYLTANVLNSLIFSKKIFQNLKQSENSTKKWIN